MNNMADLQTIEVKYFLDNKEWATRSLYHVPDIGDEVIFNGDQLYKVVRRVWPMGTTALVCSRCKIDLALAQLTKGE